MEISGRDFGQADPPAPRRLLQEALQAAQNDPLDRWMAQSARELDALVPTLDSAVETPSAAAEERRQALQAAPFRHPVGRFGDDPQIVLDDLHGALRAAMIIAYAQGMALLAAASQHLGFRLPLHEIPRAWRGCARLRASLLDDIATALETTPDLPGLLSDDDLSQEVMARQENLRRAVWRAHKLDTNVPALLASLDYLDSNRAAWMPFNLMRTPLRQPEPHFTSSGGCSYSYF
jgi:6-phosphogluconate dehydrogenase